MAAHFLKGWGRGTQRYQFVPIQLGERRISIIFCMFSKCLLFWGVSLRRLKFCGFTDASGLTTFLTFLSAGATFRPYPFCTISSSCRFQER